MHVACFIFVEIALYCERIRRPELSGRPLAVATDEVIRVASHEARLFGVRPGQETTGARALCPELTVLPYDLVLYQEATAGVWDALAVESSVVEPVSPELVYTAIEGREVVDRVQNLASQLRALLATPLQVGVGPSKFLAFHAARRAENTESAESTESTESGVATVLPSAAAALVAPVLLTMAPGLDPKMLRKLDRLGLRTLGNLASLSLPTLQQQIGPHAHKLLRLAQGQDDDPVKAAWPLPAVEEAYCFDAFGEFLEVSVDRNTLEHGLRCCCIHIAERLYRARTYARELSLSLSQSDGQVFEQKERLDRAVSDPSLLFACALRLLARMPLTAVPAGLTVRASQLGTGSGVQLTLLDADLRDPEQMRQLNATLAELRGHYGLGAVVKGAVVTPTRRALYTFSFTHKRSEEVHVECNAQGEPAEFLRLGKRGGIKSRRVRQILDVWKETSWFWSEPKTCTVYRVELEGGELCDLHHLAYDDWRLTAEHD